ncbi:response regulator [Lachnospiraceae bacterium 54-53]
MLKILFVDDDAIARRNMAQRIDWNAYGWNLVYTARDGVDALEYMKEDQPDIVISDIKMPMQALALDAIDYLNKPIDTDQLVDIVRRAEKNAFTPEK